MKYLGITLCLVAVSANVLVVMFGAANPFSYLGLGFGIFGATVWFLGTFGPGISKYAARTLRSIANSLDS